MKRRDLIAALLVLGLGCTGNIDEPPSTPAGESGSDPATGPEGRELPPYEAAPAVMPRLTARQYRNTVEDVFGPDLPPTPVEQDTNPYLFYTIGAATSSLSEPGAQRYADAAETVTRAVFDDPDRRDALIGCTPETADGDCARRFVRSLGKRLFRRPLSDEQAARWLAVARDVADGDPYRGLRLAVYGMLQSPRLLYRIEAGEPDPDDPDRRRYTSWEMAERLSFLLWNTTPDDELLDAAARGELVTDEGLMAQTRRLLDSPRAHRTVQRFFAQYLDLGRLEGVERDSERYPEFQPSLLQSMRNEVELLVEDLVFRRDADIRRLFSTRRTYVNTELAELYGVEAPEASPVAFVPVELPEGGPRAGVLTLGAFLTMNAHATETSPTLRGKYIRERVLCQKVPAPPDDVDVSLAEDEGEPRTLRERLEQHRNDPACAGCHSFIDPPGMLFEGFDSLGRHRAEVDGLPVDTSGELDGERLADARDLAPLLGDSDDVADCLVQQLYRHANARLEQPGEAAVVDRLQRAFAASGYRFRQLLLELVVSDGFRTLVPGEVSE